MAAPLTHNPAANRARGSLTSFPEHTFNPGCQTHLQREKDEEQVFLSHTHHKLRKPLESTTGPLIMQCPQSPGRLLSEEQFSCSICLEVFVEPVSTPCGHTFCMACLQGFWNHSKKFICPMCKKTFSKKPELSVNCVLAEIAQQFQGLSTANASFANSPAAQKDDDCGDFAKAGDVPCDACIGRKMKAVKSCLNCPGSFCEAHLRPHKKGKTLSGHKLLDPVRNLEDKMCKKHERLLDVYCRNEHACVCKECAETSHKTHNVVSVDREWKKVASQLGKKRSELKHLIKEREKKLEEMKHSIKVLKENSQREMEESWAVYAELQRLLEQSQAELLDVITAKQKQAEQQSRDLANSLEQELDALRRRSSELDALAQTHDRVMFLQFLPSLPPAPEPSDWSAVSVNTDLHTSTIRKSVCSLVDKFQQEVKRLYGKELRKLQNYASEVIMDLSTAQRDLCLSEDGRQVRYEEQRKSSSHSDTPRRFSPALFVLGREGLSAGRHYWEVEVGHKTAWTLGVACGSVRRKGEIRLSPDGGFWCLWLKNGEVKALAGNRVPLYLTSLPQKMAIFLDYEAGQVSFYDARARSHLYTFCDTFTESLYPIFSPCINQDGKNPGPLIISPVKHS